jgi:hypothetical protein
MSHRRLADSAGRQCAQARGLHMHRLPLRLDRGCPVPAPGLGVRIESQLDFAGAEAKSASDAEVMGMALPDIAVKGRFCEG